ncbi:MAG: HD domain-containing protein [Bryobacteraceae bacterium]
MDRTEIVRLTEEYGGDWEVQHARRLLKLISIIGEGLEYNADVMWVAAHLHDWGACPKWVRAGITHSERSVQLARQYLKKAKCPPELLPKIIEAIRFHHGGSDKSSVEAVLLCDADALDGLGVIGILREFAMIPAELEGEYCTPASMGFRTAYERVRIRMENNPALLQLEKSRELARIRVAQMKALLTTLEEETFGYF